MASVELKVVMGVVKLNAPEFSRDTGVLGAWS